MRDKIEWGITVRQRERNEPKKERNSRWKIIKCEKQEKRVKGIEFERKEKV